MSDIGTKVKIRNHPLYTDRLGSVKSLVTNPKLPWDLMVKLDSDPDDIHGSRTISVTSGQVEKYLPLKDGDRVVVIKSMLYTDRCGTIRPTSDDPEDMWDHYVELDDQDSDKVSGRVIGVHDFQVVKI